MTLAEFLLARVAEDEDRARKIHARRCDVPAVLTATDEMGRAYRMPCDCDRHIGIVLAECESKRRIVEWHRRVAPTSKFVGQSDPELTNHCSEGCGEHGILGDDVYYIELRNRPRWPCRTLRALALPYADHPDYDPTWAA